MLGTTATHHPTDPRPSLLGGTGGRDRTRLTQHVHDFLPATLRPGRHGDQQEESPGNRPERAGTEGRRSARLRAQELRPAVPSRPSAARPALPKGVSASVLSERQVTPLALPHVPTPATGAQGGGGAAARIVAARLSARQETAASPAEWGDGGPGAAGRAREEGGTSGD